MARPATINCLSCNAERAVPRHGGTPKYCVPCAKVATLAANRAYKRRNPDVIKAGKARYRAENLEKVKAYEKASNSARYAANPEPWKAATERRRLADPERYKAEMRAFYQANKDDYIRRARARLLKLSELPNDGYKRGDIFDRDGWVCQLCGTGVDAGPQWPHPESASIDHIVPISRGGDDMSTNVQLAHLSCNMAKGARTDG